MSFNHYSLEKRLKNNLENIGFTKPTEIQNKTVPLLLENCDIIGIAQTGTGKTAAFSIPLINKLLSNEISQKEISALILAPTRELAIQLSKAIGEIKGGCDEIRIATIYGGAPYPKQIKELKSGANIVVATPGRLIDMIERKVLNLELVRYLVLDEADEMLKMGFEEDIKTILSKTDRAKRQTALFSATMPDAIRKITSQYLNSPQTIQVTSPTSTHENIDQKFAVVQGRGKTSATYRFIISTNAKAAIIFTRTRVAAEMVGVELAGLGLRTATISGDVAQKERERIMERMKQGKLKVLVATDVAARGIDISQIELVVNYDLPDELENYIHRIGRTGRAGRKGIAISFVTPRQTGKIKQIEKLTKAKIHEIQVPAQSDVQHALTSKMLDEAKNRINNGRLNYYSKAVQEQLTKIDTEHSLFDYISALIALAVGDDGRAERESVRGERGRGRGENGDGGAKRKERGRGRGENSDGEGKRGERGRAERGREGRGGGVEKKGSERGREGRERADHDRDGKRVERRGDSGGKRMKEDASRGGEERERESGDGRRDGKRTNENASRRDARTAKEKSHRSRKDVRDAREGDRGGKQKERGQSGENSRGKKGKKKSSERKGLNSRPKKKFSQQKKKSSR